MAAVLRAMLWPKGRGPSIWAVLDCARDPRLQRAISSARNFSTCLYSGRLSLALERCAPHLVQLEQEDDKLTQRLLDGVYGENTGILLRSDAGLDRLRGHFRKLLTVQDERRRRLVFRFYDPRVLRVYLPTCQPSELDELFGPVQCFWTEEQDPGRYARFFRKGAMLEREEVSLSPARALQEGRIH